MSDKLIEVRMLRGARYDGKRLEPEKTYKVRASVARQMFAAHKCEYVTDADRSDGPLSTENAGALTGEGKSGGKADK